MRLKILFLCAFVFCAGALKGQDLVAETSAALCKALDALDPTVGSGRYNADAGRVYDSVMLARRDELVRYVEDYAMREGISPYEATGFVAWEMLAGVYRGSENFKRAAIFNRKPIPAFDPTVAAAGQMADSLLRIADARAPIDGSEARDCVKQALGVGWRAAEVTGRYAVDESDVFEQQLTQWLLVYSEPFRMWRVRVLPASQNPCMTRLREFMEDERMRHRDAIDIQGRR